MSPTMVGDAVKIAGWAADNSRKANLKAFLDKDWSTKNRVILPEDGCGGSSAQQPVERSSACHRRGLCTCTHSGRSCWRMVQAFLGRLKAVLPRQLEANRKLLLEGHIFFVLRGLTAEVVSNDWQEICREALGQEAEPTSIAAGQHWYHLGLQYLKPFRPTMQALTHLGSPGPDQHQLEQNMCF